jgi:hypothetical protein
MIILVDDDDVNDDERYPSILLAYFATSLRSKCIDRRMEDYFGR